MRANVNSLVGTLNTKIVGIRYYNGYATIGEMVMLRREPHNPVGSKVFACLSFLSSFFVRQMQMPLRKVWKVD